MKTIDPIAPAATMPEPEWIRVKQACDWSGLCRSAMYALMQGKRIKSVSLREKGQARGTRLISFPSLKAFLERKADEEPPPMPDKPRRRKKGGESP